MYIQFADVNFCDIRNNTHFSLSLTPSGNWYQDDINLLYDHTSNKKLFTTGADNDSTSVYVTLDMGDLGFFNTIKLLNTNAKAGSFDISKDNVTWTNIYTFSGNSSSSIHWYDSSLLTDYDFIRTSDGRLIYTASGEILEPAYTNECRYIRITITETILVDQEKYIGELYIGNMAFNLTNKRIVNYRESVQDPKSSNFRDYLGYRSSLNIENIYNSSFSILRPSELESAFLKELETKKLVKEFFPCPDADTEAIDHNISINDVYLIQAFGNYNRFVYGQSNQGIVDLIVEETRIAT